MKKEEILKLLEDNNIDSEAALIATSCDAAWHNQKRWIRETRPGYTFDNFCDLVSEMWYDCPDHTSLTAIADWVADWLCDHEENDPENYSELYEEYGD